MRPNTIRDTIRGIILGVLILALMIVGVLLASGVARADGTLTPQEEVVGDRIGATLCEYLDNNGVNRDSLYGAMQVIYRNTPTNMDLTDSVDIINYAVYTYCPGHWPELVAFGEGARSGG